MEKVKVGDKKVENEICPVCGYYCLGNGGFGCVDKPTLVNKSKKLEGGYE